MSEPIIYQQPAEWFFDTIACPCGGDVKSNGETKPGDAAQWQHNCEKCGRLYYYQSQYPHYRAERKARWYYAVANWFDDLFRR
jgi:hypothetical protein